MYSGHNFYFKPDIVSFALLPVIDRKGIGTRGLSNRKHLFNTVRITHLLTSLILRTRNAIAKRIAYRSPVFVRVLLRGRSWTTQSPIDTPERERSLLGRRSQVMSPNTIGIISSG
jgi:hypothetical protein